MGGINKRIVVLSSHTPSLFWFRADMMEEFIQRGYTVYALGNEEESKWNEKFSKKGIIYEQISVQRNGLNPLQDRRTLNSIKAKLMSICPDKIFTYQAKTIIYGAIAANMAGITEVYPLVAGMGSVFLADDIKSRMVRKVMILLYRKAIKKCPVVFFQNHDDEKIFRDAGIIKKQTVKLLHGSGVNTDRFEIQPFPDEVSFLCIGRLIRDKGINEYLLACQRIKKVYPEVRCLLVGPYDTNPSALRPEDLDPFIKGGIIEYFGETEDVRPYLSQASVYVLPSYREGTPKTNLEAMACGRPVITTDAPGCKETVIDNVNGFLVPVNNIDALYQKMKWFISNPEKIKPMGIQGRKMVEKIFDVKKVNDEICEVMQL